MLYHPCVTADVIAITLMTGILMSTPTPSLKFAEMTMSQKMVFSVKFCLFLASFGFAFPTLLSD